MAGSTPDPLLKVFLCIFLFSGTGRSSVRFVHLTGEYFGIINGKEPLVSWLTVFSQCHTHDKWNFGNVDEVEVMMTLVIREIECVEF